MSSQSRRGIGRVLVTLAVLAGVTLIAASAPASAATAAPAIPAPTLTGARTTAIPNMPVTFTFRQTKGANSRPAPTGTVTISDGTTTLTTLPLSATGAATYTAGFAEGTHTLTATYTGDATYPEAAATATPLVVAKGSTYNTLTSTKAIVGTGRPARFSARAYRNSGWTGTMIGSTRFTATAPGQDTVTEEVSFSNSTGVATWAPTLPDATWTIIADYLGNQSWTGSTSPSITQLVGPPVLVSTVDQANVGTVEGSIAVGPIAGFGQLVLHQSFVAGRSGSLDKVSLRLNGTSGAPFDIAISAAGSNGLPTGPELGSATGLTSVNGFTTFDLTTPAAVAEGASYVITITAVDYMLAQITDRNVYQSGFAQHVFPDGRRNPYPDYDLIFQTWVV